MYAVSEVYERYSDFRRGAVWAKIVVPNIPLQNGVAHIIDNVLGIVSNTIDQVSLYILVYIEFLRLYLITYLIHFIIPVHLHSKRY